MTNDTSAITNPTGIEQMMAPIGTNLSCLDLLFGDDSENQLQGQQQANEETECLRCWKNGLDIVYSPQDLYSRFCPNCNAEIKVCSKHLRTYSPHGARCRLPGFKFFKRPYLRKLRVLFLHNNQIQPERQ